MTLTLDVRTPDGGTAGTVGLDEAIFGIEPNMAALHQAVTAQLAARRAGSHSTLTRAEVRGGGAKPWRQKGTGRSRQGSIRSPQWAGGGVAHGPKPRDYRQKVNRKTVRLALRSALSDRVRSERVMVIDEWRFAQPRTKDAVAVLENLSLSGQVLLVLDDSPADQTADRSFRNLPSVSSVRPSELNAYDILRSDWLVFTTDTLPTSAESPSTAQPRTAPTSSAASGDGVPPADAAVPTAELSDGDATVASTTVVTDEPVFEVADESDHSTATVGEAADTSDAAPNDAAPNDAAADGAATSDAAPDAEETQ